MIRTARALIGRHRCLISMLLALALVPLVHGQDVLQNLRPAHPRLLVLDEQIARLKQLITTDPWAGSAFKSLQATGEAMLSEPTAKYALIGPRLLQESKRALRTITTTAGLYRLTGDARFADRARQELLAVAKFKDWHPPHFLDTAEMTNAVAIGYDWIYDRLSPQDRTVIVSAIVEKGLKAGLAGYENRSGWTRVNFNWAQVCAGGMAIGALAVADVEPDIARRILELTRTTIMTPMSQFTPDGGWEEGPNYWGYATQYNVFYLAALQSALGTDFGLLKSAGFAQSGLFAIHSTGPLEKTFNFADATESLGSAPQMFWLASYCDQPLYAAWERARSASSPDIFHLLWFTPAGAWPAERPLPLDATFRRIDLACFRSAWGDPEAWFVGFKGGDNSVSHAHLDLGTFVLDALGQRWAVDLGRDDYNMPGYFGKERFSYYRLGTAGHNTLTINGQNQNAKGTAPIIGYYSMPKRASALVDMTTGYTGTGATSVWRGICLLDRKRVLVQDEIDLAKPADLLWNFHTPASVQLDADASSATLTLNEKKLRARVISPASARFEVTPATAPPPQNQNAGISNMVVRVAGKTGSQKIVVVLSLPDDTTVPSIDPLSSWQHD